MRRLLPVLWFAAGCGVDVGLQENARCDGELQPGESSVDIAFDRDGDGYFDGSNPECQQTYPAERLDCDDALAEVNPAATEVGCNGLDDDCDAATPDEGDLDGDGFTSCDDCDDTSAAINPLAQETSCNGLDDDCDAATPDARDADGDGYDTCTDCDDTRPFVSPVEAEVLCNGLDDDCNPATEDDEDADGDGEGACSDCDDGDATVSSSAEEVCDNGVDDDCDGDTDEDCEVDLSGRYSMDKGVSIYCAFGVVNFSFSILELLNVGTNLSVFPYPYSTPPGTMTGSIDSTGAFSATVTYTGSCNEYYTTTGQFTDDNNFEATFEARYTGSGCYDCKTKTWTFTGSR